MSLINKLPFYYLLQYLFQILFLERAKRIICGFCRSIEDAANYNIKPYKLLNLL